MFVELADFHENLYATHTLVASYNILFFNSICNNKATVIFSVMEGILESLNVES